MEVSAVVGLVNFQLWKNKQTIPQWKMGWRWVFILFPYECFYPVWTRRSCFCFPFKSRPEIMIWMEIKCRFRSVNCALIPPHPPPSEEEFPKFVVQNTEMCHNTNTTSSALAPITASINKAKLTSQGQLRPALLIKSWKPERYAWWSNMTAGSLMQTDREDLPLVCRKTDIRTLGHRLPWHPASEIATKWFVNGQIDVQADYVDGHNWKTHAIKLQ